MVTGKEPLKWAAHPEAATCLGHLISLLMTDDNTYLHVVFKKKNSGDVKNNEQHDWSFFLLE